MKKWLIIPIIFGILIFVFISLISSDDFLSQTETVKDGRKIIENDGVMISAKIVEHCSYKPDGENDGYKVCEAIIEGYNPNYTLTVDIFKFLLDKDIMVKDKKYDVYFSNQFELYNETLLNKTCFTNCTIQVNECAKNCTYQVEIQHEDWIENMTHFNNTYFMDCTNNRTNCDETCSFQVERKRFYNWTLLPKDKYKTTYNDVNFAYKIKFEFPQYESAYYDFEISYKKQSGGEIPILLDPDIASCGTLNVAGATYTQTQNIIPTVDANCIIINNENITYNGNGFWIVNSSNDNSGIYSDQDNTTIKNCNVSMERYIAGFGIYVRSSNNNIINNTLNNNTAGIYVRGSNNNIINNTVKDNNDNGIFLYPNTDNNNITNNIVTNTTLYYGIHLYTSSDNILINNTVSSNGQYGIHIHTDSHNNVLINNTANNNSLYGIYLSSSSNNNLTNNIANDNDDYGIYLYDNSNNNTLTNNTANLNDDYGIGFYNSSNNILTNNNADGNEDRGISLTLSSNNTLINNTASNGIVSSFGISLTLSSNNTLINNIANNNVNHGIIIQLSNNSILTNNTANDNSGVGIYLSSSSNNTLINNTANSNNYNAGIRLHLSSNNNLTNNKANNNDDYGVYLSSSSNNAIIDSNISRNTVWDAYLTSSSINNTFLNVSYSLESVDSTSELIRKWYFEVQVNYTNSSTIENANVTAYNISNDMEYSELTDSSGQIGLEELIEYINNGTKNYHTPHVINTTKVGFVINSTTYNLTIEQNLLHSLALLEIVTSVLVSPADNSGSSTFSQNFTCNQTAGINLENSTLYIWNSTGLVTTNSTNVSGTSNSTNFSYTFTYDNAYEWNCLVYTASGDYAWADSNYTFNMDTTSPDVNITNPLNTTYTSNVIELRYTALDNLTSMDSCWYSNDSGVTNHSITCGTNVTLNASQGSNTWCVYGNDTIGNENNTVCVTFTIDGLVETEGDWTHNYPRLNQQTRWTNSLTIKSYLNYNYNHSMNITADTLAVSTSTIVKDQDGNAVTHTFDSTSGNISWTDIVYGYTEGTSNTTYFNIWYNNTKINLTSANYTTTENGKTYEIYNLTIITNSTREISDAYVYFNFSDTSVVSNILYNCTSGSLGCTDDISDRSDVTWSDVDGDGNYDYIEWFVGSITHNRSYQLKNLVGYPVQVTQDIDILNPPIKVFSNVNWRNTITMYNPNSHATTKVLKLELPFGSRDLTMDDISKNLQYDPGGILSPYLLIIDKNDPSHTDSVYLGPGQTKVFTIEYTTDSVTVHSETYFPTYFEVDEMALIVYTLTVKNQADDTVTDIEYRIPIDYAEDLIVCTASYESGCPEEGTSEYEDVTLDIKDEVKGDYNLNIDSIGAGAIRHITLSFYVPTATVKEIEEGRRSIQGILTNFKKITIESVCHFVMDDLRYEDPTIRGDEIIKVLKCNPNEICDEPLIFTNAEVKLGTVGVGEKIDFFIWWIPTDAELPTIGLGWIARLLEFGKRFEVTGILKYIFGWFAIEDLENGQLYITTGRLIIVLGIFMIIVTGLIFIIMWRKKTKTFK